MKIDITQEDLKKHFIYDPEVGVFTWLHRRGGASAGSVAGSIDDYGYRYIHVFGCRWRAHRLAWLWVYGEFPKNHIDHIDGNKQNNKIKNLRDVDRSTNQQNFKKARKDNISGMLGVSKHGSGWRAKIFFNGKTLNIGTFRTKEAAHEAYISAKREFHKGFIESAKTN